MWIIIVLIVVGALLLVAELVLLPGLSVAGIAALISYGGAVYTAFTRFGPRGGIIALVAIIIVSAVAAGLSLRAKTWKKLALNHSIDSKSQESPQEKVKPGDRGTAITRLNPIGKISLAGETYEGRSLGDVYVDPGEEIEVVSFENFSVIVRVVENETDCVCENPES